MQLWLQSGVTVDGLERALNMAKHSRNENSLLESITVADLMATIGGEVTRSVMIHSPLNDKAPSTSSVPSTVPSTVPEAPKVDFDLELLNFLF